ncbi:MAG: iron-sulfur cluster assembly scaffold protein [Promethearchaeota archaeon]
MKSTQYSEKVLENFKHPQNVGTLEGPDVAYGRVGNPVCGDIMEMYVKIKDDKIEDIKFQTFGCGSAVATSSMTTQMVKGMTLDEAMKVTRKDVAEELDGLPPIKMHCSNLAADALHEAINNYRAEKQGDTGENEDKEKEKTTKIVDINTEKNSAECEDSVSSNKIVGELSYLGKGLSYSLENFEDLKDQRVLILFSGDESIEKAIKLTEYTGRVILLTEDLKIHTNPDLRKQLQRSDVKVLTQGRLLEILGEGEVEQVKILNLDENDKYNLFVDAVVILQKLI